jgi:plasmid maintenance system antidote protein VapI
MRLPKYLIQGFQRNSLNRLSDIINGKRGVTADTDLRLCKFFGLSEGYFTGIQLNFERIKAKQKIQDALDRIVPLKRQAIA